MPDFPITPVGMPHNIKNINNLSKNLSSMHMFYQETRGGEADTDYIPERGKNNGKDTFCFSQVLIP